MVFSFLPKNVHFISKNTILCLFLKNVSPSKRVICFIFGYKKVLKNEVEKLEIWQKIQIKDSNCIFQSHNHSTNTTFVVASFHAVSFSAGTC